jgi:DNA-binding MarR family transcriptional regulator
MKPTISETARKTTSQPANRSNTEADRLADFMMLAQRSCLLDLSNDLNKGKVSYAQFFLLGYLDDQDCLTMTDIAKKMGHSTAAATGLVDRLQKLGYVSRVHAEDDRRKILVRISDEGRALVQSLRNSLAQGVANMMSQMDESDRRSLPVGGVNGSRR